MLDQNESRKSAAPRDAKEKRSASTPRMNEEVIGYSHLTQAMDTLRGFDDAFMKHFAERPTIWFYIR